MSQIELTVIICTVLVFSLFEKPHSLALAAFYNWVMALSIIEALPHISTSQGHFDFRQFTHMLISTTLGEALFRFVLVFIGLYFARKAVKKFSPHRLFAKK